MGRTRQRNLHAPESGGLAVVSDDDRLSLLPSLQESLDNYQKTKFDTLIPTFCEYLPP